LNRELILVVEACADWHIDSERKEREREAKDGLGLTTIPQPFFKFRVGRIGIVCFILIQASSAKMAVGWVLDVLRLASTT
jgi:hypothetical protein